MPRIQCATTYNGLKLTLYGFCAKFELGDYCNATLTKINTGYSIILAEDLTPENYDALCEILSLNAELQPD